MNNYIGIIVAEIEEMNAIKNLMLNLEELQIYNLNIFKGKISNKDCLLVRSGVGKVNASRTTQILTDNFKLECIINLGSAGRLKDYLNIGDIVIGEKLVQHDFDVTAFGRDKGYIPETGMFFECDNSLLQKCVCIEIDNINISTGIIASGDVFCTDIKMMENIMSKFNADCVEMEGAAIAQVCYLNNVLKRVKGQKSVRARQPRFLVERYFARARRSARSLLFLFAKRLRKNRQIRDRGLARMVLSRKRRFSGARRKDL